MQPDPGNRLTARLCIGLFLIGLLLSNLGWSGERSDADDSNILFFDAFCCGKLDRWSRSPGRFPLEVFNQSGVLNWQNLTDQLGSGGVTTGRLPIEDYGARFEMARWPTSRVGTCMVVRASTGESSLLGYRLRIEGKEAWLEKHSGGKSWKHATLRAGPVDVEPERFHTVILEVQGNKEVKVRAKIWAQATAEPDGFQLELLDDTPSRITAGSLGAGIWFSVAGEWSDPYQSADVFTVKTLTTTW